MNRAWRCLDPATQAFQTSTALQRAHALLQDVEDYRQDARADDRRLVHECKCCFYLHGRRIGGSAMTTWYCGVCGREHLHSSTATPWVCHDCATTHELCTQCGGDVQMRRRRKRAWAIPQQRSRS